MMNMMTLSNTICRLQINQVTVAATARVLLSLGSRITYLKIIVLHLPEMTIFYIHLMTYGVT